LKDERKENSAKHRLLSIVRAQASSKEQLDTGQKGRHWVYGEVRGWTVGEAIAQ
jgi:hypothetical protein